MQTHEHNQDEGDPAPPALVQALKGAFAEKPFVPGSTDDAILRAARDHLEPRLAHRSPWIPILRWAGGLAAAAVCAWLVFLLTLIPATPRFARGDVNRDGKVDILDAFALSRAIESGAKNQPEFDLNGDGRVDRADVALASAEAVSLSRAARGPGTSRPNANAPGHARVSAPFETSFLVINPRLYR